MECHRHLGKVAGSNCNSFPLNLVSEGLTHLPGESGWVTLLDSAKIIGLAEAGDGLL
jgi:hypothetical protein